MDGGGGRSAETSRRKWEEERWRAGRAKSAGRGLSLSGRQHLTGGGGWKDARRMALVVCWPWLSRPLSPQEDAVSLSASSRSVRKQQASSGSPGPERTSVPPADVNNDDPHPTQPGLRRKRTIWKQNGKEEVALITVCEYPACTWGLIWLNLAVSPSRAAESQSMIRYLMLGFYSACVIKLQSVCFHLSNEERMAVVT